MREVFTGPGTWFSLAVVVWSYAGQTIGELRWKPDLTLRETGQARANLFIHRTLVMGLLVFWGKWGSRLAGRSRPTCCSWPVCSPTPSSTRNTTCG